MDVARRRLGRLALLILGGLLLVDSSMVVAAFGPRRTRGRGFDVAVGEAANGVCPWQFEHTFDGVDGDDYGFRLEACPRDSYPKFVHVTRDEGEG